jgi:hypothetical protein
MVTRFRPGFQAKLHAGARPFRIQRSVTPGAGWSLSWSIMRLVTGMKQFSIFALLAEPLFAPSARQRP